MTRTDLSRQLIEFPTSYVVKRYCATPPTEQPSRVSLFMMRSTGVYAQAHAYHESVIVTVTV